MNDIAVVTYTTSKYADVWAMHFGQLSEHKGPLKSYAFSDEESTQLWKFPLEQHQLVCYKNSDYYWKQYVNCLEAVNEDFIIYSQEDFILFSDVNIEMISRYQHFLQSSNYDYVRLIRCGYQTPLDRPIKDDIFEVHMDTDDAFSMQATLWKKESIKKLYEHVKSVKWLESDSWNVGSRNVGIRGTLVYNGEPKIGAFHYDSIVWPYVCTAINKAKWNIDQYPKVMDEMFKKYNVDPRIRGIRQR